MIQDNTEIHLRDIIGDSIGMYVLYIAIGLAVLFLGIIIYDHFRGRHRRRHSRRFDTPQLTFRQRILRPFTLTREIYQALRDAAQQRARRKERAQRLAEQMRKISK